MDSCFFAKNMGKNIEKKSNKIKRKYSQKTFYHAKKSTTGALDTT